jgi:hypothetical protein
VSASTPIDCASSDRPVRSSNSWLAPQVYRPEEQHAEHEHDDEDPAAQRLAQGVGGDDPHETAST